MPLLPQCRICPAARPPDTGSCVAPVNMHRGSNIISHVLQLEEADDWEDEVDEVIARFEEDSKRQVTYTICFY